MENKGFGYLGFSFQQALIKAIVEDRKYGDTIVDVINPKYFDNNSFKFIVQNIKELYDKYDKIPDYSTLEEKIILESSELSGRVHIDTLENIKKIDRDDEHVKVTALNFCRQQNLKKQLKLVNTIIEQGDFESYNEIETIIKEALQVGVEDDGVEDVFNDVDDALKDDFREPIPTGITGIDNQLKGGLGKKELGVVLAPTGTGKTTLLTKFANTAYNLGYNVLQIFFEDNMGQIKRKHYTVWTGITPDEQPKMKDEVKVLIKQAEDQSKGYLKLLRFSSGTKTINDIRNIVRKVESEMGKVDLLVIDYIDCLTAEKSNGQAEEWKSEGGIMRGLESMTNEMELVTWTATQGDRGSISSEVVTGDQMGGSIKKAQIAHVILSIGKTLEQKELKLGTLAIIKSRIGGDGVVFNNCKFDNEFLEIDTETQNTLLGMEKKGIEEKADRARRALERVQNHNNSIN